MVNYSIYPNNNMSICDSIKNKITNELSSLSLTNILSASCGAVIAEITTLPICTIKTNFQTNLHYKSMGNVIKHIYNSRGIMGFYGASFSSVISQSVSTATKFTAYNYLKTKRQTESYDIKNNFINGMIGGVIASAFSHPFDVIKIHQQNGLSFLSEFKQTGASILYRGYTKSFTKNILITSLVFPLYDFYKTKCDNTILASGLSAATTTIVIHPVDYLKVRQIGKKEYYYRGVHLNLMRVIPHFIITMVATEYFKTIIQKL
jgi:uncharacterized membrane protein YeaQ/YmgE (transglycosylase-associated protein family)